MKFASGFLIFFAGLSSVVQAQSVAPSREQMIEQLRPQTRGLRPQQRNLVPEPADLSQSSTVAQQSPVADQGAVVEQSVIEDPRFSSQQGVVVLHVAEPVYIPQEIARPEPLVVIRPPDSSPSLTLLVQFGFNSASIDYASRQVLTNLAQVLQSPELKDSKFAIEGHTDAKGGSDYNFTLSRLRAQAVLEWLVLKGTDEERLIAIGLGFSELANPTEPFAAENRRVRIVNLE